MPSVVGFAGMDQVMSGMRLGTAPTLNERSSDLSLGNTGAYVFLIAFLCVYYVSNASVMLGHFDLGWHLAAGDLIRERGAVPFQDPWSFTLGDKRWYNLSWLWDVIASVIVQTTGLTGLALSVIACGVIIVACLTSASLASGASAVAACLSVFAASVLYPSFATDPNTYLSASPNTATMLFCAIFYAACFRRQGLIVLPALMALWVNLHGGFVIGFLLIGLFGGDALLKQDWAIVRTYVLVGLGCFAAVFINPLGWHIYEGVTATLGHFVQAQITEWEPYHRTMRMPGNLPAIVYMLVFVALELRYGRSHRVPLVPRVLAWLFLLLGLHQFRYMSFFFMFSAIPVALHIDRLLPKRTSHLELNKAMLAAGIAGACALPLTFMQVRPTLGLSEMISQADARYLQAHHSHSRVLNHWNVGGLVIYYTRGTVPVFVDGRAATAYPDDLLRDYLKLATDTFDEAAWDYALEKYRIDTVFWVKAHQEARQYLVGKKGWKEEYSGLYETIYVKP